MKEIKSCFKIEDRKIYIKEVPKIEWHLYEEMTQQNKSAILKDHTFIGNYFGKRYKTFFPVNTFHLLRPKIRDLENDNLEKQIIVIEPRIIEIPKIVIKNVKKKR